MLLLLGAAAALFTTTPATEMPMMSAVLDVAACQRFADMTTSSHDAHQMLDINNWDQKDRDLASYAIEQGKSVALSVNVYQCARMMTRDDSKIKKLAADATKNAR